MPQLSHAPSTGWVVTLLEGYASPSAGDAQLGLQDQGLEEFMSRFSQFGIQIFFEKALKRSDKNSNFFSEKSLKKSLKNPFW